MKNGPGAHNRRHASAQEETTNNVSYAPGIVSIPQLRETVKYLLDQGKEERVDFLIPCLSWCYLQLSPNNEYVQVAERYMGRLPYKMRLQARDVRDYSHPAAHWVSGMKKCWRYDASQLYSLFAAYDELEDDNKPLCLSPDQAMCFTGGDDKASAPCGRKIAISAVGKQSARAITTEANAPRAGDHDWACEGLVASVLHCMNHCTVVVRTGLGAHMCLSMIESGSIDRIWIHPTV